MKADIFIPTSNRSRSLKRTLLSLQKQTDKNFRIILVGIKKDNKIEKLVLTFKNLNIIYFVQKNSGLVSAANEALKITKADLFIRSDDDVVFAKNWLKNIIRTFEKNPKIGGVTGPTLMSKKGINSRDLTAYLNKFKKSNNLFYKILFKLYNNLIYENKMNKVSRFLRSGAFTLGSNYKECLTLKGLKKVDNLEACNWSVRAGLLKKINGFDPIFSKGLGDYSESDAALKIKKLGYHLVFNPKAITKHKVETSKDKKIRPESFWRIQNFIIFYIRHIKIKNTDHLLRFSVNLLAQNCYYLINFLKTGVIDQLGSIPGTIAGLIKVVLKINESKN